MPFHGRPGKILGVEGCTQLPLEPCALDAARDKGNLVFTLSRERVAASPDLGEGLVLRKRR